MDDLARDALVLHRFLDKVPKFVETHRSADGGFRRFLDGPMETDTYGLADAVGALWSVDALPRARERLRIVSLLSGLQNVDGSFPEPTHGAIHATAMATGSLLLLGAPASADIPFLNHLWSAESLGEFLRTREWSSPWFASHDVAGLAAVAASTRAVGPEWYDAWFAWLDKAVDPTTGLWPVGGIGDTSEWPGLFANLGCAFHMHFTYLWHHRLLPHAEQLVDVSLRLFDEPAWVRETESLGFAELDWIYSLRRAVDQSGYRVADSRARLERFRRRAVAILADATFDTSEHITDLHTMSATIAIVAELRGAFPEMGMDGRPSRSVLASRPFI